MTRLFIAALAFVASSAAALAEGRIRIAEQFGIGYLPLHVIRDQELIEKHGRAQGLEIAVEWSKLGGGASANDAVLSGSIDVASGGIGPLLTIWDRTRGRQEVRAIAALGSQPYYLLTSNPKVRSIKDFTTADKIALPSVAVSAQARTLQIAAEKEFGAGKHGALDELTVSLPHPDATAALLAGSTEITGHFSSPPFQYQALRTGRVHKVLSSYDVMGGPTTAVFVYGAARFRADNPKTYRAFVSALREAVAWINDNKAAAADTYVRVERSKLDPDFVRAIVADPEIRYTLVPENTLPYATFLARIGAIKVQPSSWRDYFFDDVAGEPGS
ncbi:MAG: ABC transporter substrate-binding protein [Methylobacteriaceae bacterium]|nr:ABC transporter substrate-binding protein [Methylobacteriaceae bacterium]